MIKCFSLDETGVLTEAATLEEELTKQRLYNTALIYASIKGNESTVDEIFNALWADYQYKQNLYKKTDQLLAYDDEIVEIEELDEAEMYDISVGGDELFYANQVLTKNSAGLPATADLMWGVIETEELAKMGIQMIKQIKSRYADKNEIPRVNMGVRKGNQRWYETENSMPQQPQAPVGSVSQADRRAKLDEAAQKIHF